MSTPSSRASIRHRAAYDSPQPNGPEAIAMRRIVAEMGFWLSPLLKDHPVPVLTEWEATVDLTKMHEGRMGLPAALRPKTAPPANRAGRERAYTTPTLEEVEEKRRAKDAKARGKEPVEATPGAASPLSKPLSPEARATAIANIAARAAEQAAKEAAIREERSRRADAKAARDSARQTARHAERMKTDPAYAEEYRLKRREWERVNYERRKETARQKRAKAAEARKAVALANADAIAAAKAAKVKAQAAAKRALHRERMASDPAYADQRRKLEREAYHRKQERIRAMGRAMYGPLPTAKELVAEAKAAEVQAAAMEAASKAAKAERQAQEANTFEARVAASEAEAARIQAVEAVKKVAAEEARLMKIFTKARKKTTTPKGARP